MERLSKLGLKNSKFKVIEVTKVAAPDGIEDTDWHQYLIKRGATEILGRKPGSRTVVTRHAKQIVADLNARGALRGGSVYAARKSI